MLSGLLAACSWSPKSCPLKILPLALNWYWLKKKKFQKFWHLGGASIVKVLDWRAGATKLTCLTSAAAWVVQDTQYVLCRCQQIRIYKLSGNLFPQQKSISKWNLCKMEFSITERMSSPYQHLKEQNDIAFRPYQPKLFEAYNQNLIWNWSVKMNFYPNMSPVPNYGFRWFLPLLSIRPQSSSPLTIDGDESIVILSSQQFRLILSLISANPSQSSTSGL